MRKKFVMCFIRALAKILVNLKVLGYDQIPQSGPFLLTTSHTSRLDTPFLLLSTPRKDVIPIIADKYKQTFFIGWIMKSIGVIWMNRDETDFGAFRTAISYLKKGWIVGIAPEGTRSKDQTLQQAKSGAALLAARAKVPIVPVAITGSHDMANRLVHFHKMQVIVKFGKAYYLPELDQADHKTWLAESTDEIMCRIAALLPEANRGMYAQHPRLKELLSE